MAYETQQIGLQEWVYVRWNGEMIRTTIGRMIFNMAFPEQWNHAFVNKIIDKGALKKIITDCYRKYGNAETARFLDAIKDLGFHFATLSGTTVSISDIIVPRRSTRSSIRRRTKWTNSIACSTKASSPTTNSTTKRSKSGRRPRKRLPPRCRRRRIRSIRCS